MKYSVEPDDEFYLKWYQFLSFVKNMGKGLCSEYGQNLLDSTKKSENDALKTTSKKVIQKVAEVTRDLAENKIAEKITKAASKTTHEDPNKLTAPTQIDETSVQPIGIPKERYISPERQQQIIDELRLL